MLHVLAEPDASRMRADRHIELRGEEQRRDHLVDAAKPAGVDLADVDRLVLEQLLEDDAVLHVLAGRDVDRLYGVADSPVPEHVVRARRLLDPRVDLGERPHCGDCLVDAPSLVRIERQLVVGANRLADDARAPQVGVRIRTDLHLQMREAVIEGLARAVGQRILGVAEPAGRRGVRRKEVLELLLGELRDDEREAVLGGTAARAYRLS